jgi:hypothetical protein
MITKCLVTLLLVTRTALAPALAFAAAQLAFSGVVLAGYTAYGWQLWQQVGWWGMGCRGTEPERGCHTNSLGRSPVPLWLGLGSAVCCS